MMNTIWSTPVQTAETLYSSRSLRFADCFKEKYLRAFALDRPAGILEIGCGPGALAQALARWYPGAEITGIDRDSNFIQFAAERAPHIRFLEGDAAALPFQDGTFDATISYTVSEHIRPDAFFGEQRRVLKTGGICLVLSARRGIQISAPCAAEISPLEEEVYRRADPYLARVREACGVGRYHMSESELPAVMQKYGFQHVSVEYLTIDLTPDDPKYDAEMARAIIDDERQNELDTLRLIEKSGEVTREELEQLRLIKNERFDRRLALYEAGIPQWDVFLSLTMAVRGVCG